MKEQKRDELEEYKERTTDLFWIFLGYFFSIFFIFIFYFINKYLILLSIGLLIVTIFYHRGYVKRFRS